MLKYVVFVFVYLVLDQCNCDKLINISQIIGSEDCPRDPIPNGFISFDFSNQYYQKYRINCNQNYTLIGETNQKIICINKKWRYGSGNDLPQCLKLCSPPPFLEHGQIEFEKKIEWEGKYGEGTVAKYKCIEDYVMDFDNKARICQNGDWTGVDLFCRTNHVKCRSPPVIENGFFDTSWFESEFATMPFGQEITYHCMSGYRLMGPKVIKCTGEGVWNEAPICVKETESYPTECDITSLFNPKINLNVEIDLISENIVELKCAPNYQNILAPCQSSKFFCKMGKWIGTYPRCAPAHTCKPPPSIPYSMSMNRNFEMSYDSEGSKYYPIGAEITYQCLKGYVLDGSSLISCEANGCWAPVEYWPNCVRANHYYIEFTNINAILISSLTGAGVLSILLLSCLIVACKRRKALARAVALATNPAGSVRHSADVVNNDHAVLLQHQDRLALIAFAEGVQNAQQNNSLPSYDEATRDNRSTVIQVSRLQIQRPHWPNVTVCRTSGRNRSGNGNDTGNNGNGGGNVARNGSCASHTPSMRSGGESMGSTETVTISENSTNITLDTASNHSALSQNPSCRGHCGSLASFDGCNNANTEGIPLLEESELEEMQQGGGDEVAEEVTN